MKISRNEFLQTNGGHLEILKIALPLVLGSAAHSVNLLSDRIMLSHYSAEAVAASLGGGITAFSIACFFLGTVGFTGSFVAQYYGAGAKERVGTAVWQGIFLSIISGMFLASGWFWAEPLFRLFRHDPAVMEQEIVYFQLLSAGGILLLLLTSLGTFWSGRGKTMMVMSVSFLITLLNVPFNYALIFGRWGCPELGIAGAAWGTNLAALAGVLIYSFFFFVPKSSRRHFGTCSHIFDPALLWRVVRFGAPNGFQFFIDLASFNVFIVVLGSYGKEIGAAAAIAFGLNSMAFTPCLGIGQTVAIIVGQSIGAGDIPHAKKAVKSARDLTLFYMSCMAILFVLFPQYPLALFDQSNPEVIRLTKIMLCFISLYLLFDGMAILYSSAVKAAGDTVFAMAASCIMAVFGLAMPSLLFAKLGMSVWLIWGTIAVYIMIFGTVFYLRYRGGKWTKMKVIEDSAIHSR